MEEFKRVLSDLDTSLGSSNSSAHVFDLFVKNMREENHTTVELKEIYFFNQMLVFVFDSKKILSGTTTCLMSAITELKDGLWDEKFTLAMGTPCIWKTKDNN